MIKILKKILVSTKINLLHQDLDSYRHTELVNYGSPILLQKMILNCKEWIDLHDCIIYETKFFEGKWKIINTDELIKKLNYVLNETTFKIYI